MTETRTFIKVHDGLPDHPKIDPLSDAAFRLLISGWCYCSQYLTDGVMPRKTWEKRATAKARKELVSAGLVVLHGDTVEFHDYLEHQQSAAQRQAAREQRRNAGQAGGKARAKRLASGSLDDSLSEMPSENQAEVEVEVEETPTVSPARQGATPKHLITEDWQPSPDDLVWAAAECPAVNARVETANFVDYFLDKGEKRPGWTRSWKRWMREAQLRAGARPLRAVNDRDPQYAWDV